MGFKVSDLYQPVQDLLMGRVVPQAKLAEKIRKGVLELSESYKFPLLQTTGPIVQLTQNLNHYPTSYFTSPADGTIEVNSVNSFFLFTDPYVAPTSTLYDGFNGGYDLTFRTIKTIEVLLNTNSQPVHWSRYSNLIWIAGIPDATYYIYMRYQHEHPFPNAGTIHAGDDPILFPNSWQDICEYMAAMRMAQDYNLSTKVTEFHTRLYGDAKFQSTEGLEGQPGLIFKRTSQENRDQSTSMKRIRLRMR